MTVPTKTSELTNDSNFISSLPKASANSLGAIKVGNNLTISNDGTLSSNSSTEIQIGTTTTGPAGSDAIVTNVGTATAPIFNFIIPQGIRGIQGL